MQYKFYMTCPRCGSEEEYVSNYWDKPRRRCESCLLDRAEIVEMATVESEELPVLSQCSRTERSAQNYGRSKLGGLSNERQTRDDPHFFLFVHLDRESISRLALSWRWLNEEGD